MGVGERVAAAMNRLYDGLRDPAAFRIRPEDAIASSFETLRGHKYALLVTFRRNGQAVPTPVWLAVDAHGKAFLHTSTDTGKVKRIRNNPQVLIAPSNLRGKPKGPVVAGTARVLATEDWPHAEATLAGVFGLGRKLYERAFNMPESVRAYIELSPCDGS